MPSSHDASQKPKQDQLIAQFEALCHEQLELCETLEDIADSLGECPDRQKCLQMALQLTPIMARAHAFEAEIFFPSLVLIAEQQNEERTRAANRSLDQLKGELEEDIGLVGEVAEALAEFGQGKPSVSPNAMGYLLRGLFVGLRRHLAHENQIVRTLTHTH